MITMSEEKVFYVYAFLRPDKSGIFDYGDGFLFNMEPFYIGKGHGNRILNSTKYDYPNSLKLNVINKIHEFDMNIKSIKLKENLTEKEAFEYERKAIKQIGRISGTKKHPVIKKGPLANMTDGGEGYTDVPVLQYDITGVFLKEYSSIGIATLITGAKNITYVCTGKRRLSGKYIWRYKDSEIIPLKINVEYLKDMIHQGNTPRAVVQYDIFGNFIKRFDSIKEAMEITGCNKSKIVAVCKGTRMHTLNFKWKYENEL